MEIMLGLALAALAAAGGAVVWVRRLASVVKLFDAVANDVERMKHDVANHRLYCDAISRIDQLERRIRGLEVRRDGRSASDDETLQREFEGAWQRFKNSVRRDDPTSNLYP